MPQVLGGRLAERFSAKWTLLAGLLTSSALTSATPWIATLGVAPLVAHRIILGFVHGLSMPSSVALVARWAPRRERSTFVALVFCGRYMGIVVATLLFGHLSSMSVAGGWPFAFYMSVVCSGRGSSCRTTRLKRATMPNSTPKFATKYKFGGRTKKRKVYNFQKKRRSPSEDVDGSLPPVPSAPEDADCGLGLAGESGSDSDHVRQMFRRDTVMLDLLKIEKDAEVKLRNLA
ncbi:hypothetical protein HPB52_021681 [Rhipicephalus sanguineus]|uniref:Major facilitator superfamily (MFS) profile domain-containing protein n=1 Tax=Rhipicephalus sanguineus TaxID=34632 RepID=A0A9D4Q9C3_RHISA|nr:hypothetical protein HPB52_021681 [Rhipicephalus sanguineus]